MLEFAGRRRCQVGAARGDKGDQLAFGGAEPSCARLAGVLRRAVSSSTYSPGPPNRGWRYSSFRRQPPGGCVWFPWSPGESCTANEHHAGGANEGVPTGPRDGSASAFGPGTFTAIENGIEVTVRRKYDRADMAQPGAPGHRQGLSDLIGAPPEAHRTPARAVTVPSEGFTVIPGTARISAKGSCRLDPSCFPVLLARMRMGGRVPLGRDLH